MRSDRLHYNVEQFAAIKFPSQGFKKLALLKKNEVTQFKVEQFCVIHFSPYLRILLSEKKQARSQLLKF